MMQCFYIWFPLFVLIFILAWCSWTMYCDLRYYIGLTQELLDRLRLLSDFDYKGHMDQDAARRGCVDGSFDG